MAERRNIGQILMGLGRITADECESALRYQRDHGGYFGEALLALGLLSQDELEWGLASQFDLPYVFPDADSVDPEAVALVSPEWALAHLTLPIMKTADTLTVIVDSPLKTDAVDELAARTDLKIQLALAGPGKIRDLIRQVYARASARNEGERPEPPVTLKDAVALALNAAAARFGVSTRKAKSWFWYDEGGTIRRRVLDGAWEPELDQLLEPAASAETKGKERARWKARMMRDGIVTPMDVRYLADETGSEYMFRPAHERSVLHERFAPPSPGVLSEIRLLSRSGSARFIVTANPESLGHEIIPHLPVLLLDPSWRSIYVNAGSQKAAGEAFSIQMPEDPGKWSTELETLRAFHFDVVTVDLTGNAESWASSALDVASVAFLLWPDKADRRPAWEASIRWELHLSMDGELLDWSLEPLHF
jgi:hypothetical protein